MEDWTYHTGERFLNFLKKAKVALAGGTHKPFSTFLICSYGAIYRQKEILKFECTYVNCVLSCRT